MNLQLLQYVLLILFGWSCMAQESEIKWNKYQKLTWEDFQGNIEVNSVKAASTSSGVRYSASMLTRSDKIEITFEIHSYFNKNRSWRYVDKQSEALLRHEQGHFDIAELHARLLRKAYAEYQYSNDFDENILDEIFQTNRNDRDSVQTAYDKDTNHSLFKEGQVLWENFISNSISTFESYENPKVIVVIDLED